MNCPRCQAEGKASRTAVLETRAEALGKLGFRVRRRRRCAKCHFRFTTFETAHIGAVRKRDGKVEPFDERKLLESLRAANHGGDVAERELRAAVEAIRGEAEARAEPVDVRDVSHRMLAALEPFPDLQLAYRKLASSEGASGRVRKAHGEVEAFSREKLGGALREAVHRHLGEEDLERLLDTIEERVAAADPDPVQSSQIRTWIEDELRRIDPFAYLRVASTAPGVDVDSLRRELLAAIEGGLVRKGGDRFEPFSRRKLIEGIRKATVKRGTISGEEAEDFADAIARRVREERDPVDSKQIGDWVLEWLKQKDPVAYMNFLLVFNPPDSPRSLERALEDWRIDND